MNYKNVKIQFMGLLSFNGVAVRNDCLVALKDIKDVIDDCLIKYVVELGMCYVL
jgi:hypothetical protein